MAALHFSGEIALSGFVQIVLFHNYFSPSGEQPEQCISAHKSEQPTAGCIAISHKYCYCIKHEGIIKKIIYEITEGMWLIVQNATVWVYGAWIRIYLVLCLKTYCTFGGLFWSPAGSQRDARCGHILLYSFISWHLALKWQKGHSWCLLTIITRVRHKKTGSIAKCMVRHKKVWFDTKMPGSTQQCPPQHTPVDIAIIKHGVPTGVPHSEVELQTEFKSFTAAHLGSNTNQHTDWTLGTTYI